MMKLCGDDVIVLMQLKRCQVALQQATTDSTRSRRRCDDALEENGRLVARIEAFAFSSQEELSQLSSELRRRGDMIEKLRSHQHTLEDTISRQQDQVGLYAIDRLLFTFISDVITTRADILESS